MTDEQLVPTDLERAPLVVEDERVVEAAPVKEPETPGEWIKLNLFSGPFNSILTLIAGFMAIFLGFQIGRFVFVTADWTVIKVNWRLFMIGRFPLEEAWRAWFCLYLTVCLIGVSMGSSRFSFDPNPRARIRRGALGVLASVGLLYVTTTTLVHLLIVGVVAVFALTYVSGRRLVVPRRTLLIAWLGWFVTVIVVLRGFGGVPPNEWGGFMLNLLLAVIAIVLSFPVGVLLAIGRRSTFPVIRTFCVGVIEFIRGVPLFTLLLFGEFVLQFLLPPGMRLPRIIRALFMITIFSAAYVAEIVRGGLQSVPTGQFEAAKALGLSTTRTMGLIALPQALRSTIPAMIGQFISLFKDTSLVAGISFLELVYAARLAPRLEFSGLTKETLLIAGLLFWIVGFSMGRWSQRLEKRLGVGER